MGLKKENTGLRNRYTQHEQAVVKEQEQAAGDSPVKKPRGRPPKQEKLERARARDP